MIRPLARAALIGCVAALIADVLLQLALNAVRLDSSGWTWLAPTLLERGRWIVAAGLVWLIVRLVSLDAFIPSSMSQAAALLSISRLMLILPLAWGVATIILLGVRLTLDGGWLYEGRVFLTSDFYGSLISAFAPWALGGVALAALSRHIDPS